MKSIKSLALKYFDLVGFASVESPPTIEKYAQWLNQNMHGDMEYLKNHFERKRDPTKLLPKAKSWIVLAYYYDTQEPLSIELSKQLKENKKGWISRYARGEDYHGVILKKLKFLIDELKNIYPDEEFLPCVDFKAVLERDTAQRAGLGWVGKNTCLINKNLGSFIFLAEILTTLTLEPDPLVTDHCGSCTRCIEVCPTGALEEPRVLNATKCISFWTIESKKSAPQELARKFENNVFGCDLCQDVCPWNQKARKQNTLPLPNRDSLQTFDLREFVKLTEEQVREKIKSTALERAGAKRLLENAKQLL